MEKIVGKERIQEALDLITEAVRKRSGEVGELISGKYAGLVKDLSDIEKVSKTVESALKRAESVTDQSERKAKEMADTMDKRVRKNPWPAVGAAAGIGMFVGFLVGRKC